MDYGARLLSSEPYGVTKYCRPEVRRQLRELLKQETYDVILCDFIAAAGVIPWDFRTPKVLFTHNVEATIWRRHYEVASNPIWKAISWGEWKKMEAAELRYLRLADRVLTVSETDLDAFAAVVDRGKLTVIPTGVDVEFFQPMPADVVPNSLVFTGSMDWLPNEDAIFYFADTILPLIRQRCPDITLEVVGRNPSRKLQALAERVGKAAVSTSVGAEGLPVHSGENILLADTPQDFAAAVMSLLGNPVARKRMGSAARILVQENYSWTKVAEDFARTLQEVTAQPALR